MKALIASAIIFFALAPTAFADVVCKKTEVKRPGYSFVKVVCKGTSDQPINNVIKSVATSSDGSSATSIVISRIFINSNVVISK
jgi:hypothetical protein